MSAKENKAIVRRIYEEVTNGKNWGLVDELLVPGFVWFIASGEQKHGREDLKQILPVVRNSLPDYVQIIEDQIAEGDRVVVRYVAEGTHVGEYMGVPGTGKRFRISGIDIWRLKDGKLVELWSLLDNYSFMEQVGAIPASA